MKKKYLIISGALLLALLLSLVIFRHPSETYTNSALVDVTIYSPNHSGRRTHKIDTVTIHCMAADISVENCGSHFENPESKASSNYGIDSSGKIALYVDEENRSWCSSNEDNDNRAVTIEVANTSSEEPYPISDAAYDALIDLLVDICQRNEIDELRWEGDPSLIGDIDRQNMTVHRWFAQKDCPGDTIYGLHPQIAKEVNARLEAERDS